MGSDGVNFDSFITDNIISQKPLFLNAPLTPLFFYGDIMTKCLFDYNAEELIRNKDIVLMRLRELEISLMKKESEILLTTDFKELKLTNEKQRTAYVNKQTVDLKEAIKAHKHSLTIVDDLLKLRLMEVKQE